MPSALQQSRDILARGVARIRSGFDNYGRNLDKPGAEIDVAPFDAQNVSTPAALIKLGTSIAAARRHRANEAVALETAGLEREKTRAEIARIRSEGEYYAGTGRQPAARPAPAGDAVIGQGPYKGWTVRDAKADMDSKRTSAYERGVSDRAGKVNRVPAARAVLTQADKDLERVVQSGVTRKMAFYEAQLGSSDPAVRDQALRAAGVDPAALKVLDPKTYPREWAAFLETAREGLRQRTERRVRAEASRMFEGRRAAAQGVIDEAAGIGGEIAPPEPVSNDEVIDYVPDGQGGFVPAPR